MNRYKIDYNTYGYDSPYTLYGKLHWFGRWQSIQSFKTKEDARAYADRLQGLPIYIPQVAAS